MAGDDIMKGDYCLHCAYNDEGSCSCFDTASVCCPYHEDDYLIKCLTRDADYCDMIEREFIISAVSRAEAKKKAYSYVWTEYSEHMHEVLSVEFAEED